MFWLPTFMKLIFVRATPRAVRVFPALFVLIFALLPGGAQGFTRSLSFSDLSNTRLFSKDLSVGLPSVELERKTVCPVFVDGCFADLAVTTLPQSTPPVRTSRPGRQKYPAEALPIPPVRRSTPRRRVERALSERILDPHRATLNAGCAYNLGTIKNLTKTSCDVFLPWKLHNHSTLFFEGHTVFENACRWVSRGERSRVDCAFGVGYRTLLDRSWLLGVNGFLDVAHLDHDWHWSPGFGFETDIRTGDWQCLDFSLNFYRGGGIDLEAGYTFGLWDDHADLRVMAAKYRFFDGEFILGWRAGVGLFSPDRTVGLTYEFSQDSRNPACHTIGLQASLSFRLEDFLAGKPALRKPDPSTSVRRDLANGLSRNVARMWRQPASVVAGRHTPQGRRWTTPGKVKWWLTSSSTKNEDTGKSPPKSNDSKEEKSSEDDDCCRKRKYRCDDSYKRDDSDYDKDKVGCILLLAGALATYIGTDYTYRWAFGPYELEPYEKAIIEAERKKYGKDRRR